MVMKKSIVLIAALCFSLLVAGCRNDRGTEILIGNETTVRGILSAETKTTLDEGGTLVRWSAGDSLGVFNATAASQARFTLSAGSVGSTDGIFTGTISGTPAYAYYPYSAGAGTSPASLKFTLPVNQTQTGTGPDMRYDLKVGSYAGNAGGGHTFDFRQKYTLLRFVLTPGAALAGDKLSAITFSDSGRRLAGEFTLNITSASNAPSFSTWSDKVTLSFPAGDILQAGTPVVGWMFINAAVTSGDNLVMEVVTDNHIATVSVAASKSYQAGYRYNMPLDIASLVASGKATVSAAGGWHQSVSELGVYTISGQNATEEHVYIEFTDQIVLEGPSAGQFTFGIQSLKRGILSEMTFPSNLSEGAAGVSLSLYRIGDSGHSTTTYSCKVVKAEGGLYWLEDTSASKGFVVKMTE